MAKPFIAARIPQTIADKLDEHSQESGKGKTEVIINALAQYLGCSIEVPEETRAVDRLVAVEKELIELKIRVGALEKPTEKTSAPQIEGQRVLSFETLSIDNTIDNQIENNKHTESKESSSNISDVINTDKQSKKKEKPAKDIDQRVDNSSEREYENIFELATSEVVELIGISRKILEYSHKTGKFPLTRNGYTVLDKIGRRKSSGKSCNTWKVAKTDNEPD